MTKILSISIISLFAAILTGCGAGMPTNVESPDALQMRLEATENENKALRAELEEAKAEQAQKEKVNEQVAGKIQKRGLLDGNESESIAEPSRQQRGNPFGQLASRGAVNRGVCRGNGIGPGVGHVFANMEAAKAEMQCNGFCFFLTNTSESNMSVRVGHHAVTLCNGMSVFAPATMRNIPGTLGDVPMSVSMAPPHSVVVLGKFYRSTSFQVELHDQLAPGGMFITHSEQEFSKVFPSGSPNGYSQHISPKRAR